MFTLIFAAVISACVWQSYTYPVTLILAVVLAMIWTAFFVFCWMMEDRG